MTHMRKIQARRMTVALVGAAAAMVLGVGGAIAVAAQDGRASGPTPVPAETSDTGSGGLAGGGDTGAGGGGSVSGSGGTDGGSSGSTDTGGSGGSESPAPTDGPTSHPTAPASLDDLAERIDGLEKKVDELPTKKELADALRAFADALEQQD
ncbi:hypothetical protein OG609_03080 [Streptomyces sp. NBC_01224]|uniref:hypothetical protein n=1 Tax=unclassified Streptomyces TaxID=2593676 RepID=UPI002E1573B0|nr:hypothetical protein OG609_03080 [Streptomyces sp. NBC_01224]